MLDAVVAATMHCTATMLAQSPGPADNSSKRGDGRAPWHITGGRPADTAHHARCQLNDARLPALQRPCRQPRPRPINTPASRTHSPAPPAAAHAPPPARTTSHTAKWPVVPRRKATMHSSVPARVQPHHTRQPPSLTAGRSGCPPARPRCAGCPPGRPAAATPRRRPGPAAPPPPPSRARPRSIACAGGRQQQHSAGGGAES